MDNVPVTDLNTEQRILEAARKEFIAKGFAGARMQAIADDAGINKALLHYYFRSKDKLFDVIFREAFGRLLPGVAEIFGKQLSIFEKIEQFTEAYISLVIQHPFIPAFVLSEMHRNPDEFFTAYFKPEMQQNIQQVGLQLASAVQEGLIRPFDPRQLVMNLMSLCVFPFVARPVLQRMMHIDDEAYEQLQEQRKKEVSRFFVAAITPEK